MNTVNRIIIWVGFFISLGVLILIKSIEIEDNPIRLFVIIWALIGLVLSTVCILLDWLLYLLHWFLR